MTSDKETDKIVLEAQALEAMFESSGWSIAQREMDEIIAAFRDIRTVPREGDIAMNLQIREETANALEEWLNSLKSQVNNVTMYTDSPKKARLVERR